MSDRQSGITLLHCIERGMKGQWFLLALVFGLQACIVISSPLDKRDSEDSEESLLWSTMEKAQDTGKLVKSFAEMYYEDHIKPVTDSYIKWANERVSSAASHMWDRISQSWSKYWSA
ncbi:hypothetical protein GJAV_G00005510 [Gymnothorax javanicus]|nr:hypothetical protein GJAV_G00005510 [Gymnothorax javanicus]